MKESTTGSIPRVTITMQNFVSEPVTTPTLKVRRERTGSQLPLEAAGHSVMMQPKPEMEPKSNQKRARLEFAGPARKATRSCARPSLAVGFFYGSHPSRDQILAGLIGLPAWPSRPQCSLQKYEGRIGGDAA